MIALRVVSQRLRVSGQHITLIRALQLAKKFNRNKYIGLYQSARAFKRALNTAKSVREINLSM